MIQTLLFKQSILKTIRKQGFYKNIGITIILSLSVLYFIALFFILGLTLGAALSEVPGSWNPVQIVNGGMIYACLLAILLRYFIQPLNAVDLQVYQTLPIARKSLVNYLIYKPLINPANYAWLIFLIPFAIKTVAPWYGNVAATGFILTGIMISMFDLQGSAYLKRVFSGSLWKMLGLCLGIAAIPVLDVSGILPVAKASSAYFTYTIQHPLLWPLPLLLVSIPILLQNRYFKKNYYMDAYMRKDASRHRELKLPFLKRFGNVGEIIHLEIRLLMRHKRAKAMLWISFIYLFFGFLFFTDLQAENMKVLGAILVVGLLMISYGQWIFSWNSSHFDAILTKNISTCDFVRANYILMFAFCLIPFILSLFYIFIFDGIINYLLSSFLYCAGWVTPFMIYFSTFNSKRIDLNNKSAMNYQGTTMKNFLVVIPVMFFPMLLHSILQAWGSPDLFFIIIELLGFAGILATPLFIRLCVKQFSRRKYKMADGFREKE